MSSPYVDRYTGFTEDPAQGSSMITRQEVVCYEWRNDTLFKITTVRTFSKGGTDYHDVQTTEPVCQ